MRSAALPLIPLAWAIILAFPQHASSQSASPEGLGTPLEAQNSFALMQIFETEEPEPPRSSGDPVPPNQRVRFELADGSVVTGTVESETETSYTVLTTTMGTVVVDRSTIVDTQWLKTRSTPLVQRRYGEDPDFNSLLFVPTPETLPEGDAYYRNFELLFNNFGITVADGFSVSAAAAFPITSDFLMFSFGGKLRILSREDTGVGLAVAGSGFFIDNESAQTLTGIAGIGDRRRSLNVAINYVIADGNNEVFWMVGGDVQIGSGFKLLAEYANSQNSLFDDEDFSGLINVGFRAFWSRVSFTLTGFRPLEATGDGFIAFPMASFSAHF